MKKILTVATTILVVLFLYINSPYKKAQSLPIVSAQRVSVQNIYNYVTVKGSVEESASNFIKSPYNGIIEEIYVTEGQQIEKGDIIAKLHILKVSEAQMITEDLIADLASKIYNGDISSRQELQSVFGQQTIDPDQTISITGSYYDISSPYKGTVMELPNIGGSILKNYPIFKISDLDQLNFKISIPEIYSSKINPGMIADITWAGDIQKTYKGQVASIMPYAVQTFSITGQATDPKIQAIVTITDGNTALKPGYSGIAKIYTDYKNKAMVIPYECIFQEGEEELVYVLNRDFTVKKHAIKTGYELDSGIDVTAGVSPDDVIILNPTDDLFDGCKVRVSNP